jgi:histidyl-tRNA synthetase
MTQKPSVPKGTRDFLPLETARRNYIFETVRDVYLRYGFQQIETPALENLSTLTGKYGDEGDRLLFKILDSGDFFAGFTDMELLAKNAVKFAAKACGKGLRYDLTVPFARFVVQHRNDLPFPFKRFQIQPVWRADRPQKGRYREFFQCDGDVVGSASLLNEVELVAVIDDVFRRLGVRVSIRMNNRKILAGIAEELGEAERLTAITVAVDKLDKAGLPAVNAEMLAAGVSPQAVDRLLPLLNLRGGNGDKLAALNVFFQSSGIGRQGIEEMEYIFRLAASLPLASRPVLDLALARGLNYYTGAIFEVKALDVEIGSIAGGGRYDDLTGVFGMTGVPGVGVSFGADRIYDVLARLDLFPPDALRTTQLMFVNFGEEEVLPVLPVVARIRAAGIRTELYPQRDRIKKQLSYADARGIPYVALAGAEEIAASLVNLRQMSTGLQQTLTPDELIERLASEGENS